LKEELCRAEREVGAPMTDVKRRRQVALRLSMLYESG
jgi:hypothetical protein